MIHLLDGQRRRIPDHEYAEIEDALPAARVVGGRVCVSRLQADGTYVDLAYLGPNGWKGPGAQGRGRP